MSVPIRVGGGRWLVGRAGMATARPLILAVGLLVSGPGVSPCAAQSPGGGGGQPGGGGGLAGGGGGQPGGGGLPGAQTPVGTQPPGVSPGSGLSPGPGELTPGPGATGSSPLSGGLPALPGSGGVQAPPTGASAMSWNSTGAVQPEPIPIPPRAEPPQPPGPLPLPALFRLPSVTLDHYGDGSGTVSAGLVWMGQLPHQYRVTRYHDGNGKVGGPIPQFAWITPHSMAVRTKGTLSYGPPGLHPGFSGFGLSFHPGYGYGGNGLGVGALGGYPCYGGPGYPLHYGYPKFAYPYYEGIGQLYFDQPVINTELMGAGDFGPYTGASGYAYVHPSFATEAAATGSFIPGEVSFPDTNATNPSPEPTITPGESIPGGAGVRRRSATQPHFLGMTVEPAQVAGGRAGLRIDSILPGSTAENAGLHVGDVILSIDGRAIQQVPALSTILAGAAPGTDLRVTVLRAGDGEQSLVIRVP